MPFALSFLALFQSPRSQRLLTHPHPRVLHGLFLRPGPLSVPRQCASLPHLSLTCLSLTSCEIITPTLLRQSPFPPASWPPSPGASGSAGLVASAAQPAERWHREEDRREEVPNLTVPKRMQWVSLHLGFCTEETGSRVRSRKCPVGRGWDRRGFR